MKRAWPWLSAALFTVLLGTVYLSSQWVQADLYAAPYRDRINAWADGSKPWREEDLREAEKDLQAAREASPRDASTLEMLAALQAIRGQQVWENDTARRKAFAQAAALQAQALLLRPVSSSAWANLAFYRYAADAPPEQVFDAWRRSLAQGAQDNVTQITLLNVALGMWAAAPEDMKDWTRSLQQSNHPGIANRFKDWLAYYKVTL